MTMNYVFLIYFYEYFFMILVLYVITLTIMTKSDINNQHCKEEGKHNIPLYLLIIVYIHYKSNTRKLTFIHYYYKCIFSLTKFQIKTFFPLHWGTYNFNKDDDIHK